VSEHTEATHRDTRHALCDAIDTPDGPHTLNWITDDFAYCAGCDLLYTRQPGIIVWVYDPWAGRLADALMAAQVDLAAERLGYTHDTIPYPSSDDLPAIEREANPGAEPTMNDV
jgi:hypothetical protein